MSQNCNTQLSGGKPQAVSLKCNKEIQFKLGFIQLICRGGPQDNSDNSEKPIISKGGIKMENHIHLENLAITRSNVENDTCILNTTDVHSPTESNKGNANNFEADLYKGLRKMRNLILLRH